MIAARRLTVSAPAAIADEAARATPRAWACSPDQPCHARWANLSAPRAATRPTATTMCATPGGHHLPNVYRVLEARKRHHPLAVVVVRVLHACQRDGGDRRTSRATSSALRASRLLARPRVGLPLGAGSARRARMPTRSCPTPTTNPATAIRVTARKCGASLGARGHRRTPTRARLARRSQFATFA